MNLPTFVEANQALRNGETSCRELVSWFLDRIRERNPQLNALILVDEERALAGADDVDRRLAEGRDQPLAGMVVAVKDVLCMKDLPVTCSSRILSGFRSLYDATAIRRLSDAGAVFVGRANCDEFAMGSSNETSFFGPVRNPADPDCVPGGSSGGSAAAVASGMCNVALGSDTGGSIRQPAAFCGVVGLKPTYGRISRYGLVAYASSLDTVGPLAQTVDDVASAMNVMAGPDSNDSTSAPVEVPEFRPDPGRDLRGLRIGIPSEYVAEGLDREIRAELDRVSSRLAGDGADIVDVSLPHTRYGIATYYILATAEASSNLARYDGVRYGRRGEDLETDDELSALDRVYFGTRSSGFGPEVKRRIMLGTYVLSSGYYEAYYGRAQRVRSLIRRDFDSAFEQADVLLAPTTPTPAFRIGSKIDDPLEMYLSDVYTVTANLAGIPGLSVPTGAHTTGLPIGMQLLGRHFDEATILRVGARMESFRQETIGV